MTGDSNQTAGTATTARVFIKRHWVKDAYLSNRGSEGDGNSRLEIRGSPPRRQPIESQVRDPSAARSLWKHGRHLSRLPLLPPAPAPGGLI